MSKPPAACTLTVNLRTPNKRGHQCYADILETTKECHCHCLCDIITFSLSPSHHTLIHIKGAVCFIQLHSTHSTFNSTFLAKWVMVMVAGNDDNWWWWCMMGRRRKREEDNTATSVLTKNLKKNIYIYGRPTVSSNMASALHNNIRQSLI